MRQKEAGGQFIGSAHMTFFIGSIQRVGQRARVAWRWRNGLRIRMKQRLHE